MSSDTGTDCPAIMYRRDIFDRSGITTQLEWTASTSKLRQLGQTSNVASPSSCLTYHIARPTLDCCLPYSCILSGKTCGIYGSDGTIRATPRIPHSYPLHRPPCCEAPFTTRLVQKPRAASGLPYLRAKVGRWQGQKREYFKALDDHASY